MKKHLLALVVDADGQQVFVHLDRAGVDHLIRQLEHIRKGLDANDCPHVHLFSSEWGDGELSISTAMDQGQAGRPIHHLKIHGWNEEWVTKHGFERS